MNLLFEGFDELQKSTPTDVIDSAEPSQAIGKNIVIDRVRAATITVPLVINKVETKAVIDTGAEVTVLSEERHATRTEEGNKEFSGCRGWEAYDNKGNSTDRDETRK